jgi:hypothetical protein
MKCFSNTFCSWIQQVVSKGSVSIKVNDEYGHNFQTRKGVRQGDPLSPILFNIVVDILAILINRAKNLGQFPGVIPQLVDGGLSILQYADDTIIFLDDDLEGARNMKLVLCAFQHLSGLKINFHKRDLFCYSATKLVYRCSCYLSLKSLRGWTFIDPNSFGKNVIKINIS